RDERACARARDRAAPRPRLGPPSRTPMRRRRLIPPARVLLLAAPAPADGTFPRFAMQEIDPHAGNVVYALNVADVNGDGRPDVCALTEDAIVWYENPSWRRHDLLKGATQQAAGTRRDNVCFAPLDV